MSERFRGLRERLKNGDIGSKHRTYRRDYGRAFGLGPMHLLYWHYDLTAGAEFVRAVMGQELRWWGITIPGTNWGIGIMRRVKRKADTEGRENVHRGLRL